MPALLALSVVMIGAWYVDSAIRGRHPVKSAVQIMRNPAHAHSILLNTRGDAPISLTPNLGAGANPDTRPGEPAPDPNHSFPPISYASSPQAAQALAFAQAQIGKPYRWGATGPDAYDCSGLAQAAYRSAGISLPRTTYQQILVGKPVRRRDLQPGDLVFPDPGHVQLYAGNGYVVEAPHTGARVRQVRMWGFMAGRRVVAIPAGSETG